VEVTDAYDRVKEMVYTDLEHPEKVMESYNYSYDKNSNMTKKTQVNNYPDKDTDKINETKEYTYDSLGRLTKSVTTNHLDHDSQKTNTYSYDGVGNRLSEDIGGTKTSYDYNGLDQVTTSTKAKGTAVDEVTNYSYDKNGNEISQTSTKTGETLKRTYDAKNQLSTVSKEKDGQSTLVQSNDYNGDGQRIQKTEGGNTTNYSYQDGVVSSTTDGSGTQTSQNLIGLEGNVIGTERYTSDTTSYYSYNKDIQGSTTSLIKEDGTADATYTYTDFGETRIQGDNTAGNEVCYTGGVYDSTTGLYYLNARYYNPEDGRFLTEDTYRGESTEPDTQNLYAYCANNPVNYKDPSGHNYVYAVAFDLFLYSAAVIGGYGIIVVAGVGLIVVIGTSGTIKHKGRTYSRVKSRKLKAKEKNKKGKKKAKRSGKEKANDAPDWFKRRKPDRRSNESVDGYIKRVLNEKYGQGNWRKGPVSDHNRIKKFLHRHNK
jgi:RHS repeat-associated protein